MKYKLLSPPILCYPDFSKRFILTTDASNFALGAVLSQGEVGKDKPIAYASKSLNKYELNKPVIEKELLAIQWGINHFRPYLYGTKFTVYTDHRPLVSLFKHSNPSSKMTRIRVDLMDYDFDIIYKQGKMNTNADALSRIQLNIKKLKDMIPKQSVNIVTRAMMKNKQNSSRGQEEKMESQNTETVNSNMKTDHLHIWECISISDIRRVKRLDFKYKKDESMKPNNIKVIEAKNDLFVEYSDNSLSKIEMILKKLLFEASNLGIKKLSLAKNSKIFDNISITEFKIAFNTLQRDRNINECLDIILYEPPKRIESQKVMQELIRDYHNSMHGGHSGIRRMLAKLKQKYIWKNMRQMIIKYINNCKQCAKAKVTRYTKKNTVLPTHQQHRLMK